MANNHNLTIVYSNIVFMKTLYAIKYVRLFVSDDMRFMKYTVDIDYLTFSNCILTWHVTYYSNYNSEYSVVDTGHFVCEDI